MNIWNIVAISYVIFAGLTFLPILIPAIKGVKLYNGGISFEDTVYFSEEAKKKLRDNFSRLQGTLGFWKKHATVNTRFHYYCIYWTILSSWLVPLVSAVSSADNSQKWFIVAVSSHVALALSFHRGLNVAENMKAYRHGESEFYDTYRRLLDSPQCFGNSEQEQLDTYFQKVEVIRQYIRNAETGNMPSLEQVAKLTSKS